MHRRGLAIFHAGRVKRNWVIEPEYDVPFLSSTDILQADLSRLFLISKQAIAENSQLTIRKDWILITRSGSIGRMAYARPDMDRFSCQDERRQLSCPKSQGNLTRKVMSYSFVSVWFLDSWKGWAC